VSGGVLIAVAVLRAGDGAPDPAVVTARGDLELPLDGKIRELFLRALDVPRQELRAELYEGVRVGLPASVVASLSRDLVLDVDLNDPDAVCLSVDEVAQLVGAVRLATGDREEKSDREV
jgi:hypothetical protein